MIEEALRSLQVGSLRWIDENRSLFTITDHGNDLLLVRELKPIAELALAYDLLLASGQADYKRQRKVIKELDKFWTLLDQGELLRCLLLKYPDLFSLVTVYPPFFKRGLRSTALESTIESLVRDRSIRALEFPAWRLLDFGRALKTLGFDSPWDLDAMLHLTWLGQLPAPWMLSDSAAYSLTHTVFYLTNFGKEPYAIAGRHRTYLERWCRLWCRHYSDIKNYDLLAEIIMVAYCFDGFEIAEAVLSLAGAQERDGRVPGPKALADTIGDSRPQDRFLVNYHTTLVSLMASVLGIGRMGPIRNEL